ncbi:MAG: ATP-binding cassette domain-containing protein, partial [Bacillota bacterium]
MSEILLKAENICKSFGITKAVNDVSLSFAKGKIHGLIGENGSGKSTFVSMLCGIHSIDSGRFILNEKELHVRNQVEANDKGVSIIVQE